MKYRDKLTDELRQAQALATELMQAAEKDDREFTEDERKQIEAHLATAKAAQAKIDRYDSDRAISAEVQRIVPGTPSQNTPPKIARAAGISASLGQQFVEAPGMMDFFRAGRHRTGGAWQSPAAELMAATLDTSGASGGDLITPNYLPGILPILFKRLVVADLLSSGTTDSPLISYMVELAFTNAAATVAEGGAKPESTLTFDLVQETVKKIAHWLPVTEEMLEDVSQIRSYIDARLRLGLDLTEEDQLLNGGGTGSNLTGLMNRSGLAAAQPRGSDTNADAVFKQIYQIFSNSFLMPDGIVMHPSNWQTVALSKTTDLQYYGPGPFAPMQARTLWGLPVVVTPSIVANTSLVGAFKQSAQVFRKGGVRVEVSNSHADFFVKNLVAIRAEERLGLAVYRPSAIGKVTGLV